MGTRQQGRGAGKAARRGRLGLVALLLGCTMWPAAGDSQVVATTAGLRVRVLLAQSQVRLGVDPIKLAIVVDNPTGETVLVSQPALEDIPLALTLTVVRPDGHTFGAEATQVPAPEPPPPVTLPVNGVPVQVDPLSIFAPGAVESVTVADARELYPSLAPPQGMGGTYRLFATVAVRRYAAVYRVDAGNSYAQFDTAIFGGTIQSDAVPLVMVADADGDGFTAPVADPGSPAPGGVDCDDTNAAINPGAAEVPGDGQDNDCNPLTSDVVVVLTGTIQVEGEQHTVGPGTNPATSKGPLADLPVHVYSKAAGGCAAQFGFTHQQWESIWLSCGGAVVASGVTDAAGALSLTAPADSYLVLGAYDPTPGTPNDEIYVGDSVQNLSAGGTKAAKLRLMIKSNGKKSAAKGTQFTGSELWIIEPEYVEWDSGQELYPFIFESVGDWTVTTTVTPPPGFVADQPALTTEVATTLTAAQFTITDVGSDWVDTEVTHDLTHTDAKGKVKKQKVKSKVGVKLSKALAASLGLTKWGKPKPKK